MCHKFLWLIVSPLVILLTLVQTGSAMAATVLDQDTSTSTGLWLASAASSAAQLNTDTFAPFNTILKRTPLTAAAQVTVTVPPGSIGMPQLGPSVVTTTTVPTVAVPTSTVTVTDTATLVDALAEPLTTVQVITVTQTPTLSVTSESTGLSDDATTEATASADDSELDAAYALPIEGTIIANRTEANIRFFVEGATYELLAQRSIGLNLPRVTAVLNLYNCDAQTPESTEGCFWDPYLLDRDGFYEIVSGNDAGALSSLTLQPAGSPPINQVWIQNRTGNRETIFFQEQEVVLPPASILEFPTEAGVPAIFYLRSCMELPDRNVCEWTPTEADPEIYYALEESVLGGGVPNSQIVSLELRPILSKDGETIAAPPQITCQLLVPVLNVRSGPGLEYQIVAKIRGTEQEPGRVTVVGQSELGDWLAVDARIANGGWVTASANFIQCGGDPGSLPLAEIVDGRLAPTPEPVAAPVAEPVPVPDTDGTVEETDDGETESAQSEEPPTPTPQSIPSGLALIIVNNGFDQVIRFTLDQRYRVESGPSEYDLQPGESISLLVYPGQIAFSASSPWRGLSGNADFLLEDESRTLWVTFIPDPDGSGGWMLQY